MVCSRGEWVGTSIKRFEAAAYILFALWLVVLTGCEDAPWRLDPFGIDGRDGGGQPVGYAALMRIGAAARAGGDLATAVGVYRRAASIETRAAAPFVAIGNTLLEMAQQNEAIIAYHAALARDGRDPEALRGLARAYLATGKPELAGQPLSLAYQDTPDDPKLLQLIGVAGDFAGQHAEAQARYRRGLELAPGNPALVQNLALSLALTGNFAEAGAILHPIATSRSATVRERQTLALIYGLQGDTPAAERMGRLDLDAASVQNNLAFYDRLRRLPAEAQQRAIQSLSAQH
jgi:Flp pilus assembly protein TadD